ncbi:putative pentatricopeptide repeat-containing protein At3g23330 [Cryptomeria japonica]|uniref:putative pentatricopeptide repeat-containing protein At3g23330 n=1 Tax=Cryptomeria japonica TaxID=3369 RepID=UPI0027DA8159|nr:putative pentatricopeptide repeat-containing protein At3g23330 [Cryptomeria japonica]
MPQRDVVTWTAMTTGYAQNWFVEKAWGIFRQMQLASVNPDHTTFASILPDCAKMGSLEQGIGVIQSLIESGFSSDVVASALVDMYAKCGSMLRVRELFDKMPERNEISWNATIAGYVHNRFFNDDLELFELMKHSKTKSDRVRFICVLLAYSHAGLVDKGCKCFNC